MEIKEVEGEKYWQPLKSKNPEIPLSSQEIFVGHSLKNDNLVDILLIQGGRGTGKTEVAIYVWLIHVWKGYGAKWTGLVLRTQFSSIRDTFKKAKDIIASYYTEDVDYVVFESAENMNITFMTGESLHFKHLSTEKEFEAKFKGQEYQYILFEELTSWEDGELFDLMATCLRCREDSDENKNPPLMIRATTNPDGIGRKWVKRRFILASNSGVVLTKEDEHPFLPDEVVKSTQMHIYTTMQENYKLPVKYVSNIMKLKQTNYHKYLQHMYGVWDDFDDTLLYNSVYEPTKQFIEDFDIPKNVIVKRAGDWGSDDPFCFLWYFKHKGTPIKLKNGRFWNPPEDSIIIIREYYGAESLTNPSKGLQMSPEKVAKEMKKQEKYIFPHHKIQPGPCDDYIKRGQKSGVKTNYDYFKAEDITFGTAVKNNTSIELGVLITRDMLKASKEDLDEPRLYFFESCKFLRETVFSLKADPENLDRPASKQDDHANDVIRYINLDGKNNSFAKAL